MAADTTLTSDIGAIQANPEPKTLLSKIAQTPETRIVPSKYTVPSGDVLEVGDKIRLFKINEGSVVIPPLSLLSAKGVFTTLEFDIGLYKIGPDLLIGDVIGSDIYANGRPVTSATDAFWSSGALLVKVPDPVAVTEAWVVAEVVTSVGSTAGDKIDFLTFVNSAN